MHDVDESTRHVTRGGAVRRYRDVKHMLRMENKVSKCSKTGRNGPPLIKWRDERRYEV